MLEELAWLTLEVKSLERARAFYEGDLQLTPTTVEPSEVRYPVGDSELRLRRPSAVPRGGVHTHYALSIPPAEYDTWWERLDGSHELEEATFGESRSLYCYDPAGHCVELGQQPVDGPGIDGIFEVALEVASLDAAIDFYTELGFAGTRSDGETDRVRLDGPIALELWEPRLGIADARGGVHVDLGFRVEDPGAVADRIAGRVDRLDTRDGSIAFRDPDGHGLTLIDHARSGYRNP